ncbi:unnamed protein product [Amoebophrya sp. A120]|nr:unnamed protein product [Amoebophrya sp. A120]|eukprot:GSA120T00011676001.1
MILGSTPPFVAPTVQTRNYSPENSVYKRLFAQQDKQASSSVRSSPGGGMQYASTYPNGSMSVPIRTPLSARTNASSTAYPSVFSARVPMSHVPTPTRILGIPGVATTGCTASAASTSGTAAARASLYTTGFADRGMVQPPPGLFRFNGGGVATIGASPVASPSGYMLHQGVPSSAARSSCASSQIGASPLPGVGAQNYQHASSACTSSPVHPMVPLVGSTTSVVSSQHQFLQPRGGSTAVAEQEPTGSRPEQIRWTSSSFGANQVFEEQHPVPQALLQQFEQPCSSEVVRATKSAGNTPRVINTTQSANSPVVPLLAANRTAASPPEEVEVRKHTATPLQDTAPALRRSQGTLHLHPSASQPSVSVAADHSHSEEVSFRDYQSFREKGSASLKNQRKREMRIVSLHGLLLGNDDDEEEDEIVPGFSTSAPSGFFSSAGAAAALPPSTPVTATSAASSAQKRRGSVGRGSKRVSFSETKVECELDLEPQYSLTTSAQKEAKASNPYPLKRALVEQEAAASATDSRLSTPRETRKPALPPVFRRAGGQGSSSSASSSSSREDLHSSRESAFGKPRKAAVPKTRRAAGTIFRPNTTEASLEEQETGSFREEDVLLATHSGGGGTSGQDETPAAAASFEEPRGGAGDKQFQSESGRSADETPQSNQAAVPIAAGPAHPKLQSRNVALPAEVEHDLAHQPSSDVFKVEPLVQTNQFSHLFPSSSKVEDLRSVPPVSLRSPKKRALASGSASASSSSLSATAPDSGVSVMEAAAPADSIADHQAAVQQKGTAAVARPMAVPPATVPIRRPVEGGAHEEAGVFAQEVPLRGPLGSTAIDEQRQLDAASNDVEISSSRVDDVESVRSTPALSQYSPLKPPVLEKQGRSTRNEKRIALQGAVVEEAEESFQEVAIQKPPDNDRILSEGLNIDRLLRSVRPGSRAETPRLRSTSGDHLDELSSSFLRRGTGSGAGGSIKLSTPISSFGAPSFQPPNRMAKAAKKPQKIIPTVSKEILHEVKSYAHPNGTAQKVCALFAAVALGKPEFLAPGTSWIQIRRCFSNVGDVHARAHATDMVVEPEVGKKARWFLKKHQLSSVQTLQELPPALLRLLDYARAHVDKTDPICPLPPPEDGEDHVTEIGNPRLLGDHTFDRILAGVILQRKKQELAKSKESPTSDISSSMQPSPAQLLAAVEKKVAPIAPPISSRKQRPMAEIKMSPKASSKTTQPNASGDDINLEKYTTEKIQQGPPATLYSKETEAPAVSSSSNEEQESEDHQEADELEIMPDIFKPGYDRSQVQDLVIAKPSVGSVLFEGKTDLSNIPDRKTLASKLQLLPGEIVVYPACAADEKPEIGTELNKPAYVTLLNCRPPGTEEVTPQIARRYESKVRRMTEVKGAQFLSYDAKKGIWCFRVEHF